MTATANGSSATASVAVQVSPTSSPPPPPAPSPPSPPSALTIRGTPYSTYVDMNSGGMNAPIAVNGSGANGTVVSGTVKVATVAAWLYGGSLNSKHIFDSSMVSRRKGDQSADC